MSTPTGNDTAPYRPEHDLVVEGTARFVGTEDDPLQVLRIRRGGPGPTEPLGPLRISVTGAGVQASGVIPAGGRQLELGIRTAHRRPGEELELLVSAGEGSGRVSLPVRLTVAEPGWTAVLVSHFHYDPVWWNTQAAYTTGWPLLADDYSTRPTWPQHGFALVQAHLAHAMRDPDYHFAMAELDYLKPYFDTHPDQRAVLRRLLAEGRVELIGGTYNEPNTNLTGAELTIRNLVYGMGYQRSIAGGDPRSAWQLDVFGHDPQFPGLVADCGLTGSVWARGPYHHWGPLRRGGGLERTHDTSDMQFPSEFEWIAPSGRGVLTHYLPDHYGGAWDLNSASDVEEAGDIAERLMLMLAPIAATRTVLLPVGGDYAPPCPWVTELHRWWTQRYVWPRIISGTPEMFLSAVRSQLSSDGRVPRPISRDMNPIYTGKDVSYIDTKQGQRTIEIAAVSAEILSTVAALCGAGTWPETDLDTVWRTVAFNAHHDATTGTESDQVYIDLLGGWQQAHRLATRARDAAAAALTRAIDRPAGPGERAVTVFNTLALPRSELVRVTTGSDGPVRVLAPDGTALPQVATAPGILAVRVDDVPSVGWRTLRLAPADPSAPGPATWVDDEPSSSVISNEFFTVTVDPERGGVLTSIVDHRRDRELLRGNGNELRVLEEYSGLPGQGEGPWHLSPTSRVRSVTEVPAQVVRQRSPLGERLISSGEHAGVRYRLITTLLAGDDKVDFRCQILDFTDSDRLLRIRFEVDQPDGMPVSEVAGAVVGRGFGFPEVDTAEVPWTLDNAAHTWFGIGSTCSVLLSDDAGNTGRRSIAVAEVVLPDDGDEAAVRPLIAALARCGVTATTTTAAGPRYGWAALDSNIPDVRIIVDDPACGGSNTLLDRLAGLPGAEVLALLDGAVDGAVDSAVWLPAAGAGHTRPGADVRDLGALPVLVIRDLATAVADLTGSADLAGAAEPTAAGDLTDAAGADLGSPVGIRARTARLDPREAITVAHPAGADPASADGGTIALINDGTPGFVVGTDGSLHLSLLRSSTAFPAGGWIDPPRRSAPDGSSFQWQHWPHEFRYALVSSAGDWRSARLPARGQAFGTPLVPVVAEPGGGRLPATGSALTVEPARQVLLGTLKASGHPIAEGGAVPADPRHGATLRLVETLGADCSAEVRFPLWGLTSAVAADPLERPLADAEAALADVACGAPGAVGLPLSGSAISTWLLQVHSRFAAPAAGDSSRSPATGGGSGTPNTPVYARYWLHNTGAAPGGFLPVTVSVEPLLLRCTPGGTVELEAMLASQYTASAVAARVSVEVPRGWRATPESWAGTLGPGGYARWRPKLHVPDDAEPGIYPVGVTLVPDTIGLPGGDGAAAVEDVVTVLVGDAPQIGALLGQQVPSAEEHTRLPHHGVIDGKPVRPTGITLRGTTPALSVRPGERAELTMEITSELAAGVRAELRYACPFGTWDWIAEETVPLELPPGTTGWHTLTVAPPADALPGRYWLLPKLMWAGRVQYGEAVSIEVTDR